MLITQSNIVPPQKHNFNTTLLFILICLCHIFVYLSTFMNDYSLQKNIFMMIKKFYKCNKLKSSETTLEIKGVVKH